MKKDSVKKIAEELQKANSILIFPHIHMDGDAVGSAIALCSALRAQGKTAWILIEEKIPQIFQFMDDGYSTTDKEIIETPDVSVCIDCGEFHRFPSRKEAYLKGKTRLCIDHHKTNDAVGQYNHIEPKAAATAELIFRLLKEMNQEISKEMAEAIFVGISMDTGQFQYSNTTKETHLMVAELYDLGIDVNRISIELYQNIRLEKIKIVCRIMETIELFAEGRGAIAYATEDMCKETDADMSEIDGVVEEMRNIQGVEVAVLLKEKSKTAVKVSMRTKTTANVMDIAVKYEGGGHIKAAGCTIRAGMAEAMKLLKEEVEAILEK